jgi:hypothetical protein
LPSNNDNYYFKSGNNDFKIDFVAIGPSFSVFKGTPLKAQVHEEQGM